MNKIIKTGIDCKKHACKIFFWSSLKRITELQRWKKQNVLSWFLTQSNKECLELGRWQPSVLQTERETNKNKIPEEKSFRNTIQQ